jgi:hypothetical protein
MNPGIPSLSDLFHYQRVDAVMPYLGLLLFAIGAFGEITFSNKKLMLGSVLICSSFVWRYLSKLVNSNFFDGRRGYYFINWSSVVAFVFFVAATGALLFAT